jgi:hypothetical protein
MLGSGYGRRFIFDGVVSRRAVNSGSALIQRVRVDSIFRSKVLRISQQIRNRIYGFVSMQTTISWGLVLLLPCNFQILHLNLKLLFGPTPQLLLPFEGIWFSSNQ